MKKMTFSLDDGVVEMLVEMSCVTGVSMSRIVRWAIKLWYEQTMEDEP